MLHYLSQQEALRAERTQVSRSIWRAVAGVSAYLCRYFRLKSSLFIVNAVPFEPGGRLPTCTTRLQSFLANEPHRLRPSSASSEGEVGKHCSQRINYTNAHGKHRMFNVYIYRQYVSILLLADGVRFTIAACTCGRQLPVRWFALVANDFVQK